MDFIATYWIETVFTIVVSVIMFYTKQLTKKIKMERITQEHIRQGMLSLLRNSILRNYNDYSERGYIPVHAFQCIDPLFQAYKDLGGNGTVSRLYEELKRLPTKDNSK